MGWTLFALACGLALGYRWGWGAAHRTVATECERLGSFYVGKQVYRCNAVEGRHD